MFKFCIKNLFRSLLVKALLFCVYWVYTDNLFGLISATPFNLAHYTYTVCVQQQGCHRQQRRHPTAVKEATTVVSTTTAISVKKVVSNSTSNRRETLSSKDLSNTRNPGRPTAAKALQSHSRQQFRKDNTKINSKAPAKAGMTWCRIPIRHFFSQSRRLLTKIFKSAETVNEKFRCLWIRGQWAIKLGYYARYLFPPPSIKPGTRQAGLTGRFQKNPSA